MQAVKATRRSRWKIGESTQTSFRCPASAQGSLVMYTSAGRKEPGGRPCTSFLMPSAIAPDWPGVASVPCASSRPRESVNMQV